MRKMVIAIALLLSYFCGEVFGQGHSATYEKAAKEGWCLVTFVGVPTRSIPGVLTSSLQEMQGYPKKCIVLSKPGGNGEMHWVTTLDEVASNDQVIAAFDPGWNAIDRVNAYRTRHGLRPFLHDPLLTEAARGAARHRAANLITGHTSNDFAFLPAGASSPAAGCGAWDQWWFETVGWGTCCMDDRQWTHAGAAYVIGRDGRYYMHLYVR